MTLTAKQLRTITHHIPDDATSVEIEWYGDGIHVRIERQAERVTLIVVDGDAKLLSIDYK